MTPNVWGYHDHEWFMTMNGLAFHLSQNSGHFTLWHYHENSLILAYEDVYLDMKFVQCRFNKDVISWSTLSQIHIHADDKDDKTKGWIKNTLWYICFFAETILSAKHYDYHMSKIFYICRIENLLTTIPTIINIFLFNITEVNLPTN